MHFIICKLHIWISLDRQIWSIKPECMHLHEQKIDICVHGCVSISYALYIGTVVLKISYMKHLREDANRQFQHYVQHKDFLSSSKLAWWVSREED